MFINLRWVPDLRYLQKMKFKYLFITIISAFILLTHNGCRQGSNHAAQTGNERARFTIVTAEDFEQAGQTRYKTSYAADTLHFKSGAWLLENALIGTSDQDAKNGGQSVRLRNHGKLSMQFDAKNCNNITIRHGVYGNDKSSDWQLWASSDGGRTYEQIGETITSSGHALQMLSIPILTSSKIRLEIRKISGGKNRLNIDDIEITGHTGNDPGAPPPPDTAMHAPFNAADTVAGDNSNMLLGNPSNATSNSVASADNYLINQYYYTES
ncbi:hypothetical protein BH09BAC6_BH09BAC6_22880 [soil metagenome]